MPWRGILLLAALALVPRRQPGIVAEAPVSVPSTRIVLGGDVMLSRYVGRVARARQDPAGPLRELAPYLAAADIAFVNLEAPFSDRGPRVETGMVFKTEPEMIEALRLAGIDVVSTANNHARDCGSHGLEFTLDWLGRHGVLAAGTGRTEVEAHAGAVLVRNGVRFGFLGYTYDQSNGNYPKADTRVAMLDIGRMRDDVGQLRRRADVVIVSMHAGAEYQPKAGVQQRAFAHAAIDAGASLVVGHHPHVVEETERYRDGVILYSLGNLVFDQFQRKETQRGWLAEVRFRGATIERYDLRTVQIGRTGPVFADQPRLAASR